MDMEETKALGGRLKALRRLVQQEMNMNKLNQPAFGEMVGIKRDLIAHMETNRTPLSEESEWKMGKVFSKEVMQWLKTGHGKRPTSLGESPILRQITTERMSVVGKKDLSMVDNKHRVFFFDRMMPRSKADALKLMHDMPEATQRLDIPWWNGQRNFSFFILDKALDPPYSYGNVMAAMLEDDWAKIKYGDVHVIHAWEKQFVRFVFEHPADEKKIILRAPIKKRDDFPDLTMLKADVMLIGISLGGAELNLWALSQVA